MYKWIFVFWLVAWMCNPAAFAQPARQEGCTVAGQVGGVVGKTGSKVWAIASGVSITFKSSKLSRTIESGVTGEYRIILPPGIYEISVARGKWKLRYDRAKVDISGLHDINLNIFLLPECVSFGCIKTGYDFSSFSAPWVADMRLNLVIASNIRKSGKRQTSYQDVVVTYNNYTIAANKLVQDFESKTLVFEGDGWIDDGTSRRKFDKLSMAFRDKTVTIK